MKIELGRKQRLFDYISNINQYAYKNDFLLSNPVLSKSPFAGNILEKYLSARSPERVTIVLAVKKLLAYYAKSAVWYAIYLSQLLAFTLSGQKWGFDSKADQPIFIDTYFLVPKIIKEKHYHDCYFPLLEECLRKQKKAYAYIPKFYGARSPLAYYKAFRLFKERNTPVLAEYQLLRISDYFRLFLFMVLYPFYVLRFMKHLGKTYEGRLCRFALWDNLDQVGMGGYARLLYGRRISRLNGSNIQCISWYENQSIDKNLYKGLRHVPGKVKIYGAQPFVWPSTILNLHPDEREIKFGIVPDKVLVNGPYYLPRNSRINYAVGPSFRYKRLFEINANPSKSKNILVILSYFDYETKNILKVMGDVQFDAPCMVKFHPATNAEQYQSLIRGNMRVTRDDLYDLFTTVRLVIGLSGALLEAATAGIPAISISHKERLSHNDMPPLGKGIIWDQATTSCEVESLIKKFVDMIANEPDKLASISKQYRDMFFCEPTERKIHQAYDIN